MHAKSHLPVALALVLLASCATTASRDGAKPQTGASAMGSSKLSVLQDEASTLGATVRAIGASGGGGFVVMNGIEELPLPPIHLKEEPAETIAGHLAKHSGAALQTTPAYAFFFYEGYEALTAISLQDQLDPAFENVPGRVVFGSGTPLFTAFKWMSQGLRTTVVADQVIASALSGEVALGEVPVASSVEALLKSARIAGYGVECGEDYLFIHRSLEGERRPVLLNEPELDEQQRRELARRVKLTLPFPSEGDGPLELVADALPLDKLLGTISRQLGVRVVAEKGVRQFPVNPFHCEAVSVQTAIELLIKQWPTQDCGYQVTRDRIVIRERMPNER